MISVKQAEAIKDIMDDIITGEYNQEWLKEHIKISFEIGNTIVIKLEDLNEQDYDPIVD